MDKKIIIIFSLIMFLGLITFNFDSEIVKLVSSIRINSLDNFFLGLSVVSSGVIIFFILTSLFFFGSLGEKRKLILPLWFTIFLSVVVSFLLKSMVQRQRPFQLGIISAPEILQKVSHLTWNFSFPSFKTMLVFSAIPILSKVFPRSKYVWIVFALLVALSRVYLGMHFLSDVIAGGLIGYLLGNIIIHYEKETKFWENIYRKVFKKY